MRMPILTNFICIGGTSIEVEYAIEDNEPPNDDPDLQPVAETKNESIDGSNEEPNTFASVKQNEVEQLAHQNDLRNYQLSKDRERTNIRPPTRYSYADLFCALLAGYEVTTCEPTSYEKAVKSKDRKKRKQAMEEEMASLRANNTWILGRFRHGN